MYSESPSLELTIFRNASPLHRLRRHFGEFQARLARRMLRQQDEGPSNQPQENARAPLQGLTKKQAASSIRQVRRIGCCTHSTKGQPAKPLVSASKAKPQPTSNGSFQVFVDEEFSGSSAPSSTKATPWMSLPPESERFKENKQKPTTWNQPLKSKKEATAPAAPAFEVFVDEEFRNSK